MFQKQGGCVTTISRGIFAVVPGSSVRHSEAVKFSEKSAALLRPTGNQCAPARARVCVCCVSPRTLFLGCWSSCMHFEAAPFDLCCWAHHSLHLSSRWGLPSPPIYQKKQRPSLHSNTSLKVSFSFFVTNCVYFQFVALGRSTGRRVEQAGLTLAGVAKNPTVSSLVDAIKTIHGGAAKNSWSMSEVCVCCSVLNSMPRARRALPKVCWMSGDWENSSVAPLKMLVCRVQRTLWRHSVYWIESCLNVLLILAKLFDFFSMSTIYLLSIKLHTIYHWIFWTYIISAINGNW